MPRNPFAQREYLQSMIETNEAPLSDFTLPRLPQRYDLASFTMKNGGRVKNEIRDMLERSDSYWAKRD